MYFKAGQRTGQKVLTVLRVDFCRTPSLKTSAGCNEISSISGVFGHKKTEAANIPHVQTENLFFWLPKLFLLVELSVENHAEIHWLGLKPNSRFFPAATTFGLSIATLKYFAPFSFDAPGMYFAILTKG